MTTIKLVCVNNKWVGISLFCWSVILKLKPNRTLIQSRSISQHWTVHICLIIMLDALSLILFNLPHNIALTRTSTWSCSRRTPSQILYRTPIIKPLIEHRSSCLVTKCYLARNLCIRIKVNIVICSLMWHNVKRILVWHLLEVLRILILFFILNWNA